MALRNNGTLHLFPNVDALVKQPSSKVTVAGATKEVTLAMQNPAIRIEMQLSHFIPMQSVKQLGCGALYFALLTNSGLVYTWGQAEHGALGHG